MGKTLQTLAVAAICIFLTIPARAEDPGSLAQKAAELFKSGKMAEGDAVLEEAAYASGLAQSVRFRKALFVAGAAQGYGLYAIRETAVFDGKSPLLVYAEPAGYTWTKNGELNHAVLNFDARFLDQAKTELVKIQNFQQMKIESRVRNRELFVDLKLSINGAPPGKYFVEITANDENSGKSAKFELPFEIRP